MALHLNSLRCQSQQLAGYIGVVVRFLGVVCFICGVNSDDASDFQKHLPAHLVWAVSGKDAELPCNVTPPNPDDKINMVFWFKDSTGIPLYSLDARSGDLGLANHWAIHDIGVRTYFQVTGMSPTRPARLKIHNVKPEDEGVFRCRVDFVDSPTRNFRVNLTIVVPPSYPMIYDDKGKEITGVAGPFLEGYDLALTCLVKGGRPPPKVTWFHGRLILDQESETSSDGYTRNRLYLKVVSRALLSDILRCEATSSELIDPVSRNVSFEIYLKPRTVHITTPLGPLSAGKTHQLQCMTTGSVPPAKITWLLDGEPIRDAGTSTAETSNTTTAVLSFRPRSSNNGDELACRAENKRFLGGLLEDRRRLDITYPPIVTVLPESDIDLATLKEGDDVILFCEVRANPQPDSSSVTWYHGDQLLEYKHSMGILPSGRKLMLRGILKESTGEYSCAAANSEGETRSRAVHIRVQYAPRCLDGWTSKRLGALRHETLEIKCEVTADPSDDVKFRWTYNKSRDVYPVPAARHINTGLVSLFRFTPGTEEDHGTLACWASNSIGHQLHPCLFHIVLAKTPEPPEECVLRNGTSGGLVVHCVAGFDGDLPQHFLMEISESPEYPDLISQNQDSSFAMNDMGTRHQAPGPPLLNLFAAEEPVFMLNNLRPGRDYELAVYAVNAKGRSEPPVIIPRVRVHNGVERLTKIDPEEEDIPAEHHPMTIVLGVLIAAAVLILAGIFITATLVICRRRTTSTSQLEQEDKEERPNVYSEAPAPVSPATVFSVPSHAPRGFCSAGPRVRFRTDVIEMENRRSVYSPEEEEDIAVNARISRSNNDPDLIVSRAEVILSPQMPPQPPP